MTTRRRTATAFVNRTFTNATPARNTALIHVHARTVPKMPTAGVLRKAVTRTATADARSYVKTGNIGTGRSAFPPSAPVIPPTTVSAVTTALTIPAGRGAPLTEIVRALTKRVKTASAKLPATTILVQTQNIRHVSIIQIMTMDVFVPILLVPAEKSAEQII